MSLAVVAMLVGCRGGDPARPSLSAQATTLAPAMATVPADARVVMHLPPGLLELVPADAEAEIRKGWADDTGELGREGIQPVIRAVMEEMTASPGAMGRTIGWQPGTSEIVAWARGTMGLVRVRLDGAALRASLARAEARSGRKVPVAVWRGQPYYQLHTTDDARRMHLLGRVADREALLLWTPDPERDLPVLMSDAPPRAAFDPGRVVEAMFPGRADRAHFAMMFDPRWFGELATELDDEGELGKPCGRAVVALVDQLPQVHWAWADDGHALEVASSIEVGKPTADRLARDVSPIPRWGAPGPYLALGMGVGPLTVLDVITPWAAELDRTASACGERLGLAEKLGAVAGIRGLLGSIRGASFAMDPATESGVIALRPDDLTRFWAQIRSFAPLRAQPPATGERLRVPGAVLTSDGASLVGTFGDRLDEGWLDRLPRTDGPAALVAITAGGGVLQYFAREDGDVDEDDQRILDWMKSVTVELGVQGSHLVWRWVIQHD